MSTMYNISLDHPTFAAASADLLSFFRRAGVLISTRVTVEVPATCAVSCASDDPMIDRPPLMSQIHDTCIIYFTLS